jgi:catabolite regulation protein CreA
MNIYLKKRCTLQSEGKSRSLDTNRKKYTITLLEFNIHVEAWQRTTDKRRRCKRHEAKKNNNGHKIVASTFSSLSAIIKQRNLSRDFIMMPLSTPSVLVVSLLIGTVQSLMIPLPDLRPPTANKVVTTVKETKVHPFQLTARNCIVAAALCTTVLAAPLAPVHAAESQVIGQITGSGLVFKDTLQVESFEDPKIRGVTLYISNFQRPINERLSSAKNFFSDPSSAAVACARTGQKVIVADNINTTPAGEEVFKESKSLLFKSLKVQRIFDTEHNTVIYVSFNTRIDKNDDDNKSRFQNSLCAVNLDNYGVESSVVGTKEASVSATPGP